MTRYLLPVAGIAAAMLLLVAGTLDDLPSWTRGLPPHFTGGAAMPDRDGADAASAQIRQQLQDLRADVVRETQNVAALQAAAEQTRQDLAALRDQQQRDHAALASLPAAAANARGSGSATLSGDAAATPSDAAPIRRGGDTSAPGLAGVAKDVARPPPALPLLASQRLTDARAALVAGRASRAAWLLRVARNQNGVRPQTGGQPAAIARDAPASQITEALASIDKGDTSGALRIIDRMLGKPDSAADAGRQNYRSAQVANERND